MAEGPLTFQYVIKKSVLEAGSYFPSLATETIIRAGLYLLLSLVLGLLLYFIYRKFYAGVVYSHVFAVSLAGMTVLTCAIIVAIQSNVVLSLGMVGALSIVRYRTAIKNPLDLLFLFWAVALGISIGAGMVQISLMVMVVRPLLLLILRQKGVREDMYILLVHYSGDMVELQVRRILGNLRYQIKSKTLRGEDIEMAIELRAKNSQTLFVEQIRNLEDVHDVTLVQYNGDYIN